MASLAMSAPLPSPVGAARPIDRLEYKIVVMITLFFARSCGEEHL